MNQSNVSIVSQLTRLNRRWANLLNSSHRIGSTIRTVIYTLHTALRKAGKSSVVSID